MSTTDRIILQIVFYTIHLEHVCINFKMKSNLAQKWVGIATENIKKKLYKRLDDKKLLNNTILRIG